MVKPLQTLRNLPRLKDISFVFARHGLVDLAARLGAGFRTRILGRVSNSRLSYASRLRIAFQELGPI
ncbi:MAG: hypothetical protein P8R38_00230, partial [Planctomycetota bacterium]|nr:hypothetical protein [Planctomycetota bacterium]